MISETLAAILLVFAMAVAAWGAPSPHFSTPIALAGRVRLDRDGPVLLVAWGPKAQTLPYALAGGSPACNARLEEAAATQQPVVVRGLLVEWQYHPVLIVEDVVPTPK